MPNLSRAAVTMETESSSTAGLCVLVVEDDEADAYLISRALADQPKVGKVVRATDGVEALEMVDRGEIAPDLAFIDLHMPRKNGFNLLAAFACRPEPAFPMVVLTSSTAPTDAIRSRLRGAVRVVTKPDTVEALEEVLSAAVDAVCPNNAPPPPAARLPRSEAKGYPGIPVSPIDERKR